MAARPVSAIALQTRPQRLSPVYTARIFAWYLVSRAMCASRPRFARRVVRPRFFSARRGSSNSPH